MPTAMVRPIPARQRRDPQASRRRLLDAAIGVFARKGPQAATIEEICAKAKLNKRMAYHYFGSKDGLYREALRRVYEEFFALEVELGSMLLPVEELLETLVGRYYRFLQEHPAFVRMISYENLNDGRTARTLGLEGQKAPVITALQLAMAKGQAERRFRDGIDVADLLLDIFALCFFYFSNQHTMGQFLGKKSLARCGVDSRIKHVVELLLHGISHEDARKE